MAAEQSARFTTRCATCLRGIISRISSRRVVLKKGAKLREHHTKGPIAVQLLSGSIHFAGDVGRWCWLIN
jgi:quercetin dioxygenase-like cupin family protein